MIASDPLRRLSSFDLMFLRLETPEWPCHFGGLAVLEGRALLDDAGALRMGELTERLERRLPLVPELRQRLLVPGPLGGRPVWVDDARFAIERHVHQATVMAPGGDVELLDAATRVYERPLDRRRPLWELWFLTGLSDDRVAAMLKLHHAVADGMAAVTVMGSLFDLEPDAPDPEPTPWRPEPTPSNRSLRSDNLSVRAATLRRLAVAAREPGARERSGAALGRARRLARSYAGRNPELQAARTSLNQPVGRGRRVRVLRANLDEVKEIARTHDAKVNDVVLDLWVGGVRHLLASRGERVPVDLITSVPVSLREQGGSGAVDNRSGWIALGLPAWETDPVRRLDLIAERTRKVKAEQQPAAIAGFMAAIAATPFARAFVIRQRTNHVLVTNVPGPAVPIHMFGARVLEIVPIVQLIGNLGLVLCAFSYTGRISMVVTADEASFPDLDVLIDGMERDLRALTSVVRPGP